MPSFGDKSKHLQGFWLLPSSLSVQDQVSYKHPDPREFPTPPGIRQRTLVSSAPWSTGWGRRYCWLCLAYSFSFLFKIYFLYECSAAYTSADHMRAPDPLIDGYEPLYSYWELNSGSLEEKPVFLTAEPSHQLPSHISSRQVLCHDLNSFQLNVRAWQPFPTL